MFNKLNAVLCSCFAFILVLSVNGAFASTVRVNSLGTGALVPDEEADLNYNPAFVTYIDGQRIYGGMNFRYDTVEEKDTDSSHDCISSGTCVQHKDRDVFTGNSYLVSPYLEYVNGIYDVVKIAVRYNPFFTKSSVKYEDDPDLSQDDDKYIYKEKFNNKGPVDGRLLIGFSLPAGVKIGYSLSYFENKFKGSKKEEEEYWGDIDKDKYKIDEKYYSQTLGVIFNSDSGNKYALSLGQRGYKRIINDFWDEDSGFMTEGKETPIGINAGFIPEIKFGEAVTLRGKVFFEYMWDKRDYSYDEYWSGPEDFDAKDTTIAADLGIGLNYMMDPGTLFSFTVNSRRRNFITDYKEGYSGEDFYNRYNIKDIRQDVDAGIGLEKEVLSNLLQVRCYIAPVHFRYVKHTEETEDQDGDRQEYSEYKYTDIIGPVYSYSLGIGYRPDENVMVDLNFRQILSQYLKGEESEKDYSYDGSVYNNDKYEVEEQSYNLNFAVTYKF